MWHPLAAAAWGFKSSTRNCQCPAFVWHFFKSQDSKVLYTIFNLSLAHLHSDCACPGAERQKRRSNMKGCYWAIIRRQGGWMFLPNDWDKQSGESYWHRLQDKIPPRQPSLHQERKKLDTIYFKETWSKETFMIVVKIICISDINTVLNPFYDV